MGQWDLGRYGKNSKTWHHWSVIYDFKVSFLELGRWNRYLKLSILRSNFCLLKVKKAAFKKEHKTPLSDRVKNHGSSKSLRRERERFILCFCGQFAS